MVRVLIVDDSAVMRALIARKLELDRAIHVVGTAANAAEARQSIKRLDPDVVTLDIEMPGMDGLAFLEKIMTLRPTPVIIVSGSTRSGAAATARALELGAVDCYAKSTEARSLSGDDGGELCRLVRRAAKADLTAQRRGRSAPSVPSRSAIEADIIAIGSSTGGVEALHTLLSDFPADCPPTLIVQHVHSSFSDAIIQSLARCTAPRIAAAESDLVLERGTVLLAPSGDRHLKIGRAGSGRLRALMREGEPVAGHRPSVDSLFQSVAALTDANMKSAGILLTGMGRDGAAGLAAMAEAGAHTIAQDEESCVVFGMPRAAIALGAARMVLPLGDIAGSLFARHGEAAA